MERENLKALFQRIVYGNDTRKRIDNDIPNGLSCGDMGTEMVLAAHELVHWNRAWRENAGKNGFVGEDEPELYSGVIVMFCIIVMRRHKVTGGFLATGITAARRLLGRQARFPSSGICVIGRTHNLLEPDNTCSRTSQTLTM